MSRVRVLVGTRKGAFVLTSDAARTQWDVAGPHFGGWEIHHVTGSPVDLDRVYAAQWTDWFGQVIQRSNDGGRTWDTVGNEFTYDGETGTHLWYDGTPHPWEFKRVWHLEPSPTDPDAVFAGVEDAAPFFARPMPGRPGRSCPGSAVTSPARSGSQARAACVCTRFCSTRATRTGCSLQSRPPESSAPTMPVKPGAR